MNNNDLQKYKIKLGELSVNDKKLRNLYLRDLALGKIQGPQVDCASIDKPWLKYYSEDAINSEVMKMSIYDYLKKSAIKYGDRCAINFYGNKISYSKLIEFIDDLALRFKKIGINNGDVVVLCTPTLPESIYSLYALNKIGAVCFFIDPRTNPERIQHFIDKTSSKTFIYIDSYAEKFKNILLDDNIVNKISVSASDSLPLMKKIAYNFKSKKVKSISNEISWSKLKGLNVSNVKIEDREFKDNETCAMVLTGGTTGMPKAVKLSDNALNTMSVQYEKSGIPHDVSHSKFLDIMPPFLAYGLVDGVHMPLTLGMENILIPLFNPDKFADLLLKYKPNHFMGVPTHYEKLLNSEKMNGVDLSFLVTAGAGGDSCTVELEKKINEFLLNHGCTVSMQKGFGMTEGGSALTSTLSNECNKVGSVGIPLCKNNIAICKSDGSVLDDELGYGETGEICIKSPTMMSGYYDEEEEEHKVLKHYSDGSTWIHSGDYGYVDGDGFLFFMSRKKRMIVRPDGHNIFPSSIENVIMLNKHVKDCVVVGTDSEFNTQGQYPKACIILNKDTDVSVEDIIAELDEMCEVKFPERDVPYYYEFVDEFPLTSVGKVDYRKLEAHGVSNCYHSKKYKKDFKGLKKIRKSR